MKLADFTTRYKEFSLKRKKYFVKYFTILDLLWLQRPIRRKTRSSKFVKRAPTEIEINQRGIELLGKSILDRNKKQVKDPPMPLIEIAVNAQHAKLTRKG